MEANSPSYRDKLRNQIEEAYGKIVYTYTVHIIQASRIQSLNKRMKWAELILSAISAGGFLATVITNQILLAWIGGLCSTALLVLSAYFKDMDLSTEQQNHLKTSNSLWSLREDYLSLLIDFEALSTDEIVEKRNQLKTQVHKIYASAPITDDKSYKMAQKALKENETQFFTQQELNQLLPIDLRE